MKYSQSSITLLHGDPAVATFDMMEKLFVDLKPVIDRGRLYAKSSSPVLIEASAGPEMEMLAQSIHNESDRSKGPYSVVLLSGTTNEEQQHVLFGNPKTGHQGILLDCNHGTILIQGIDKLTLPMQAQLAHVIRTKRIMSQTNYSQYKYIDIRIIASTSKNLTELRNHFLFRSDLLFTFRALRLRIPKLRDRPRDIENMLNFYFEDYNNQYGLHHVLTDSAHEAILKYPWDSNIMQLQAFCERMVLTADSAKIDLKYVQDLFHELYESDSGIYDTNRNQKDSGKQSVEYTEREMNQPDYLPEVPQSNDVFRDLIVSYLKKNHGNRKMTARDLGISTTTLWRKIHYYHLEDL